MSRRPSLVLALALLLVTGAAPTAAWATCIVDISDHRIPITTGFAGSQVLIFGTVDEPSDVVVTLRGPLSSIEMYRKSRVLGIWVNTQKATFERTPSFFAMVSSRPLEDVAAETELRLHQMGAEHSISPLPGASGSPNVRKAWEDALVRNMAESGLYPGTIGNVTFLGGTLFRARMRLPANVPTGQYAATAYCLVDGKVQSAIATPLIVEKTGIEAEIFDFAHEHSLAYGLIAVLLALVAGWVADLAFKRS